MYPTIQVFSPVPADGHGAGAFKTTRPPEDLPPLALRMNRKRSLSNVGSRDPSDFQCFFSSPRSPRVFRAGLLPEPGRAVPKVIEQYLLKRPCQYGIKPWRRREPDINRINYAAAPCVS
jgi:hypothetical protein